MNIASQSDKRISAGRLWFGFAGSATAWVALGIADLLITWQACLGQEQNVGGHLAPGFRVLYVALTLLLLGTAVTAGVVSYRNWRALSRERELSNAEGRGREEYMALVGVFVSFTLGVGIIWLGIPLAILRLCVRAR